MARDLRECGTHLTGSEATERTRPCGVSVNLKGRSQGFVAITDAWPRALAYNEDANGARRRLRGLLVLADGMWADYNAGEVASHGIAVKTTLDMVPRRRELQRAAVRAGPDHRA